MCVKQTLNKNDVISQKYMDDHICLIAPGKNPPSGKKEILAFCDDFRTDQGLYQVMMVSNKQLKALRKDIENHQDDFKNDREHFRPIKRGASDVHYTTENTYDFIECERTQGEKPSGKKMNGYYAQYIPMGPREGKNSKYQIYHGCPPVRNNPGFRRDGNC